LFSADVARTLRAAAESEGVGLFSPDHEDLGRPLPSIDPGYLAAVGRGVAADPLLRQVLVLPSRSGTGEALVYLRSPAFAEGVEYRGFGPVEGPYPQWQLPRVRWGYGPRSSLRLAAGSAARRLSLEAQTAQAGQAIEVLIDGRSVARHEFARTNEPEAIVVALPPPSGGSRVIELAYAKWNEAASGDRRPMAVLFRRIQVE
jgi:hypothetical protein